MKNKYSIDDFRLATPEEVSEHISGYGILAHPRGISPYTAYRFLKETFGQLNTSREGWDTSRVTWEYVLKGPRAFISVYDWKFYSCNFGVKFKNMEPEDSTNYAAEARKDANIILDNIEEFAGRMKVPVNEQSYQVIENICNLFYTNGEYFLGLLEQTDTTKIPELAQSRLYPLFEDACNAWAAAMSFILSIEAMFNIIFEVYLKREILEDQHLCNHVFRMPLIDKWMLFSLLCTCFSKSLNRKSLGYRSLSSLVKIRNSWAHASISNEMRTYIVEEDGLEFAAMTPLSNLSCVASSVDYTLVKRIRSHADTVRSEILNAMNPNMKKRFAQALKQQNIILDKEGKLVV